MRSQHADYYNHDEDASRYDRDVAVKLYRQRGESATADAIAEEFFWRLDETEDYLRAIGFAMQTHRFSDLSWGIIAQNNS